MALTPYCVHDIQEDFFPEDPLATLAAMKFLFLLLTFTALLPNAHAQYCPGYDVIFYNGNILTGKGLETATPERVTSVGIVDGHIAALNPPTCGHVKTSIDLHGAFAMPGFNDAHTHIAFAGQQRLTVDLDNVASLAAMQAKVKAYAATLAPGQWISGGGWDHTKWASKTLPTRQDLDAVTGGHPAYLERTDGHIAVVNTAALKAAGITGKTVAPQGSSIDLDASGEPTGIIREDAARALITAHIPKPDAATRRKALQLSIDDALAHGVTSVQDFSDWDDFLVLEQMEREHALKLRVSEWLTFNDSLETLKAERAHHDLNDPLLHTGMLKGFMDGSLGSRTAALEKPYSDEPGNSGLPRYEQKKLDEMAAERVAAGFQLGFHAIGDRANTMALNAYESLDLAAEKHHPDEVAACLAAHPEAGLVNDGCGSGIIFLPTFAYRFRIEHAQVLLPGDFDRFRRYQIIASMQPSHLLTDMAWAGDRLGPERVKYAYAWKSFLDHGVVLAFGTDYPVESISPFRGLYSAVTRMNEAGTQTFQPQEKLTIQQAVYAYTQASAYAESEELGKGKLEPGFLADMVVLDRDITKATPQEVLHTKVLRTVLGGETVYAAK
jgi:predicted amidohydrolase YtcJ